MTDIKFSKDEMDRIVSKIKTYFHDELDQEIGGFEAEFLVELLSEELGPFFYNRGLSDAHTLFSEKTDELSYLIQEMEKPTV